MSKYKGLPQFISQSSNVSISFCLFILLCPDFAETISTGKTEHAYLLENNQLL